MKILILSILSLSLALFSHGQAHIGMTESQIRNSHPTKKFTVGYTTTNGTKYISADMVYGNFTYYFDDETKLSTSCIQIPFSNPSLNGQVEVYNKKYVITSDTSWTAYLDEGGIIYINLVYDSENKISYFAYSNVK